MDRKDKKLEEVIRFTRFIHGCDGNRGIDTMITIPNMSKCTFLLDAELQRKCLPVKVDGAVFAGFDCLWGEEKVGYGIKKRLESGKARNRVARGVRAQGKGIKKTRRVARNKSHKCKGIESGVCRRRGGRTAQR